MAIAIFDFDGTIISRDSLPDFLIQACGRKAFVYPAALEEIRRHQEEGNKIAIISASVPDWIRPWAQTVGIRLVEGTGLEVREQTLTGRFSTPNCKGGEKVRRLRRLYPDFASETLHVYGDSSGDKELLALADVPHYKPFNNK